MAELTITLSVTLPEKYTKEQVKEWADFGLGQESGELPDNPLFNDGIIPYDEISINNVMEWDVR